MADNESRQVRRRRERQETRRQQFDRIHGQVLAGRSVRDMWLVYATERVARAGLSIDDETVRGVIEHAFYAGASSMLDLITRVAPENVTEDQGVEMLTRLHEELESYTKRATQ